ncbi:MAG: sigma-70 family RNA polymerase sigma factor [Gemmataceae bacterium]|nr:sigma-70 family RNA polymerase sigma factor [Gemmataceae bacterium]
MANPQQVSLLDHLYEVIGPPPVADASDGQLLDRFMNQRDEVAFAALLRRHGSMVLNVARRVLGNLQDAEDVYQATFLLLARRPGSIRKKDAVASWLHGVAYRLALRVRLQDNRRHAREQQVRAMVSDEPYVEAAWHELQELLDEELRRLPEKYRAPLVLCYLEGKTHEQAAHQLGWPVGTVRGRAHRAREMLRTRLTRRGLALSAPAFATALTAASASGAVPGSLVEPTLQAAMQVASGQVAAAGLVSAQATALAQGAMPILLLGKLKLAMMVLLLVGALAAGATALLGAPADESPPTSEPAAQARDPEPAARARATEPAAQARDPFPGAVPAGAIARLGTERFALAGSFYHLAFAPDGKSLACAQMDSTIRLLEVPTGKELGRLGNPVAPDRTQRNYWASSMTFSRDGKLLAVLKRVDGVVVWDLARAKEILRLKVDLQTEVSALDFSPDGKLLATGGNAQPPRLWEVATGNELRRLEGHLGPAPCIVFSPDGKTLATGSADQTVRLWDARSGKQTRLLTGHRQKVVALAFAPDGKLLATAADDATVRLWNPATGEEVRTLDASRGFRNPAAPTGVIAFVAFSADGKTVALGRSDRTVRFWDAATGSEQQRFEGLVGEATNVALSPDSRYVALGNVIGRLHLWDRTLGREVSPGEGHQYPVRALAYSPDGRLLASGGADRTVRLWDTRTGREVRQIRGHSGTVSALAFALDGKVLASASHDPSDRAISVWDVTTGKELQRFHLGTRAEALVGGGGKKVGYESVLVSLAFLPGQVLAAVDTAGLVWLWDVPTGRRLLTIAAQSTSVAFAPDGKHLASVGNDRRTRIFDVSTGREVSTGQELTTGKGPVLDPRMMRGGPPQNPALACCYLPDGRSLLVRSTSNSLLVLDTQAKGRMRVVGNQLPLVLTQFGPVAAVSPDGRMVALLDKDRQLQVWELATGQLRWHLKGHRDLITCFAFAPDGRHIATGSRDTSLLLWDVRRPDGVELKGANRAEELEPLWADLEKSEGSRSYRALLTLAASPKLAVPFLAEKLRPVPGPEPKQVARLVADLDSGKFAIRQKAMTELAALGELARPALEDALKGNPPLEMRQRVETLLGGLKGEGLSGEQLRQARAVEALEHMGPPEARQLLERLAGGTPGAWLTRQAAGAVRRLGKPTVP